MAKRRRIRTSSRRRGFFKKMFRSKHSVKPESVIIPAAIYGAARGHLSQLVQPLTSKIPLGQYADTALFGVAGYLLAKKGKGIIKQVGMAALTIEAASLGNRLVGTVGNGNNGVYVN